MATPGFVALYRTSPGGLESGTRAHTRLALDAGATPEEIRHAALLATTTVGFPSMMRAMTWVNDVLEK